MLISDTHCEHIWPKANLYLISMANSIDWCEISICQHVLFHYLFIMGRDSFFRICCKYFSHSGHLSLYELRTVSAIFNSHKNFESNSITYKWWTIQNSFYAQRLWMWNSVQKYCIDGESLLNLIVFVRKFTQNTASVEFKGVWFWKWYARC